jgi:putative hydrolase of the HAD superfamily
MIRHILFDLDSTLYSVSYGLEEFYFRRLREYTSSWLGLPPEESELLREDGYRRHGTTIEWLIYEKGFTDVDGYYAYLHPENEADKLPPDPELRRFLENLPCPCSILTNAPSFHAERIIKKLGVEGIFCHIFDITGNGLKGKPNASAYRRALDTLALNPEEVLFVDDMPQYVKGYIAIGGKGILFDERDIRQDFPHERIRNLRELTRFLN